VRASAVPTLRSEPPEDIDRYGPRAPARSAAPCVLDGSSRIRLGGPEDDFGHCPHRRHYRAGESGSKRVAPTTSPYLR